MKTSTIERILTPEFLKSIRGEVVSKSKISGAVSVFGLVLWNEKWKAWDLFDLALGGVVCYSPDIKDLEKFIKGSVLSEREIHLF